MTDHLALLAEHAPTQHALRRGLDNAALAAVVLGLVPPVYTWLVRPLLVDPLLGATGPVVDALARLSATGLGVAVAAGTVWLWLRRLWYGQLARLLDRVVEEADRHQAAALGTVMDEHRVPLASGALRDIREAFEAARRGRLAAVRDA